MGVSLEIRVRRPLCRRRCRTNTRQLANATWQAGILDLGPDRLNTGKILEDANAATNHRARSAHSTLECGHLRRGTVRPREPETWTEIHAVGHSVVPRAEQLVYRCIVRRLVEEVARIQPETVLYLKVPRWLVGVTKPHADHDVGNVALRPR